MSCVEKDEKFLKKHLNDWDTLPWENLLELFENLKDLTFALKGLPSTFSYESFRKNLKKMAGNLNYAAWIYGSKTRGSRVVITCFSFEEYEELRERLSKIRIRFSKECAVDLEPTSDVGCKGRVLSVIRALQRIIDFNAPFEQDAENSPEE